MKKEESRDSLIDIPLEDERDESQLTGRKAAEYNKQHVIRHRKRVRTKILCALGILLALLAILAVIAVILVNVWRSTGRASLLHHAQGNSTDAAQAMQEAANEKNSEASEAQEAEESYELQEGQIRYNGKTYQYKDNLMNILCLGIDSRDGIAKEKTPGKAGQADCVILAVLDDEAKTIQLINISRDSMEVMWRIGRNSWLCSMLTATAGTGAVSSWSRRYPSCSMECRSMATVHCP